MDFNHWQDEVPSEIKSDPLWKVTAYRLALFLADMAWRDCRHILRMPAARSMGEQLIRSAGSVSANIAEGYSRGTGKDRARFYEYALGSARETRDWYFKARHVLGAEKIETRVALTGRIIRLLLAMIRDQRGRSVREDRAGYSSSAAHYPYQSELTAAKNHG